MKKTLKVFVAVLLVFTMSISLIGCTPKDATDVAGIIAQAEKMDKNDLYVKAMEEWNAAPDKTINAVGNSSRGKAAFESFIGYLQGKSFDKTANGGKGGYVANAEVRKAFPKFDENFAGKFTWGQPKNNNIFGQIAADVKANTHTLSLTLIQDGNQIQSKMLDTNMLLNYIPKEWAGDKVASGTPLALQTLNKVFMFNNLGTATYKNCWDFVKPGVAPMFMGVDSEPVGKNFLYMLTNEHYSAIMKDAYDKLSAADKTALDADLVAGAKAATDAGIKHANAKYSFAWISRWVKQYNQIKDDGPICNALVAKSAVDQCGLLVYSKLRSVSETDAISKKNVTVAAYQEGYTGIGGYMYKHYLQVLKTSPMPWTACAIINYMTTTKEGFAPWGKDIGGYSANAACNQDHSNDGGVEFPVLNDKGYAWWSNQAAEGGQMVIEDPAYCSQVSFDVGAWIDGLRA